MLLDLHQLSNKSALLCLEVERFLLQQSIPQDAGLLLALSGGADSTALACILSILAHRLHFNLAAFTLNHGLRPEAVAETQNVLQLCALLGINCTLRNASVQQWSVNNKRGLEDACRFLRYNLLEEERKRIQADFIVLGHQSSDLNEDVLLRLIRGTGWPALGGMPASDPNRHILRPLLFIAPQRLKDLLLELHIAWSEDASNTSQQFRRNRIRHNILPLLFNENPNLDLSVRNLWQLAQYDADYWEKILDDFLQTLEEKSAIKNSFSTIILPIKEIISLHSALRLRLYIKLVKQLVQNHNCHGQMRASTLFALEYAMHTKRTNCCFQLPNHITISLQGDQIIFKYLHK